MKLFLNINRGWIKWLVIALWIGAIATVVFCIYLFSSLANGNLPSFEDLENPKYDLASLVYDTKGRNFGKYYIENREEIAYSELSPKIIDALLSTEDFRFRSHSGIDARALVRVGLKTLLLQKEESGGGSTITQQLAKLLFKRESLSSSGGLKRFISLVGVKLKEWITAVRLEKSYTKEEIIAMYLNKFEFINGAHGIVAASQIYFNKEQSELTTDEAAVLVGMLKNPSLYNPARFPEKATNRRNIVLSQMEKYGKIDQTALDSLVNKTLDMSNFKRTNQSEGPAPHFRSELTKWLRRTFAKNDLKKTDGSNYNIYTDGLKIYTTIDLDYQKHAEKAVYDHMRWNQEKYDRVWKGRNPWKHEADSLQLIIRKNTLESRIKGSERYVNLHNQYLGSLKSSIQSVMGEIPLNEKVIKALHLVDTKRRSLNGLIKDGVIKKDQKDSYRKLLDTPDWDKLYKEYEELQAAYKTIFSTKVEMQIFDYEEGEKTVEMSPRDSVIYHNKILQCGLLSVDPRTGYIKAWVGGVNHKYFKYDHINSRRQVGSTIKPFVYTAAMSLQGISPCQEFEDIQYSIVPGDANFYVEEEWSPSNANGEFTNNLYNLYQGLLYSKNSITVRLVKEMGSVEVIRELLDNAGIRKDLVHPNGEAVVPNVPSICLGAVDLKLSEMAGAYTSFANQGKYVEPIFIDRIEDKHGKVIYRGIPERKQAISPTYNHVILDMLRNNVGGNFGIGLESQVGGKTGTTNDYADGWFMGVTPSLVTGVWVGGEDKWIRFLTLEDGQGYVMARPIFVNYMKAIEKDEDCEYDSSIKFVEPNEDFFSIIDCDKYKQIKPEEERTQTLQEKLRHDEFEEEEFEFDEFDEFDEEGEFEEEEGEGEG